MKDGGRNILGRNTALYDSEAGKFGALEEMREGQFKSLVSDIFTEHL